VELGLSYWCAGCGGWVGCGDGFESSMVSGMCLVYPKPSCVCGWCEVNGWVSCGVVCWFVVVGLTKDS
jgi:hypothetical protein